MKQLAYYADGYQETVYTTREDILISNYVKMVARNQVPGPEEREAYNRRVASLEAARGHGPNCYCEHCLGIR